MKNMLASALAVTSLIGTQAFAGIAFTASITSGPKDHSTLRGFADGPKAKIEFTGGTTGENMPQGSYMLTRDGGTTLYLVNPGEKSYMKINPGQIASSVGQVMDATRGFVNMTFSNPSVERLEDKKGSVIHGLPTRHVKTKTTYTVETVIFGRKSVSNVAREDEMWITTALKDPGLNLWTQQRGMKTGNAEIDKLIELETSKFEGFPLRTVSVTRTSDARGRQETATTTYEITEIKHTSIPADTFEFPADYTDKMAEIGEELRKTQAEMKENGDAPPPAEVKSAINSIMKGIFGGGR